MSRSVRLILGQTRRPTATTSHALSTVRRFSCAGVVRQPLGSSKLALENDLQCLAKTITVQDFIPGGLDGFLRVALGSLIAGGSNLSGMKIYAPEPKNYASIAGSATLGWQLQERPTAYPPDQDLKPGGRVNLCSRLLRPAVAPPITYLQWRNYGPWKHLLSLLGSCEALKTLVFQEPLWRYKVDKHEPDNARIRMEHLEALTCELQFFPEGYSGLMSTKWFLPSLQRLVVICEG